MCVERSRGKRDAWRKGRSAEREERRKERGEVQKERGMEEMHRNLTSPGPENWAVFVYQCHDLIWHRVLLGGVQTKCVLVCVFTSKQFLPRTMPAVCDTVS